MSNPKDILAEKTYKEGVSDLGQRVFYTLSDGKKDNLQPHRNSLAISELIKLLYEKNILSEEDIDKILLRTIEN